MQINNTEILNFSSYLSDDIISLFSLNKSKLTYLDLIDRLKLPKEYLAVPEQIHSNNVLFINKPGTYNKADGLITSNPKILLVVKTADCVPVYIYDNENKIAGLVHSGWRGTINGIVVNAINLMLKMGSDISTIKVYLGPSINWCCYKVKKDVACKFDSVAKVKINNDIWKVSLHKQIYRDIIALGLYKNNLSISNICTFESLDCHSFRRDGETSGRMYAFLGIGK